MDDNLQAQGSLERLGIPLETQPSEGILLPGAAKAVRFRVSRPEGYAYADVESFLFDILIPSLDWYAQKLHERDLAVHKLGEELDKSEVDNINLRARVENSAYNDAFENSVRDTELDSEVSELLERIQILDRQLADASAGKPVGEFYSREEVEGFILEAQNVVRAEEKARSISALAAARNMRPASSGFTQDDLDKAVAEALAQQPAPSLEGFYTHEELQSSVDEAVNSALAKERKVSAANIYAEADMEAAVAAAVDNVQPDTSGLYTQDEVQEAITEAVEHARKEFAAANPTLDPEVVFLDELSDEGDLGLRAENESLRASYEQLITYVGDLEAYVARLEGKDPETVPKSTVEPKRSLPPIEAQDL